MNAPAAAPHNHEVAKTVITYTMIHSTSLNPALMSPEHLAHHLMAGEFVGERTAIETRVLSDEEVVSELQTLGNDGNAFRKDGRRQFELSPEDL